MKGKRMSPLVSLTERTVIPSPADQVWPLLRDPALVASCMGRGIGLRLSLPRGGRLRGACPGRSDEPDGRCVAIGR